jgi:hypothetical protein
MTAEKTVSHTAATSKISGYIRSVDKRALKDARVACHGMETRTLANGSFAFQDLDPGTYKVRVTLQGYKPTSKTVSTYSGEETSVEINLRSSTGTAKICGHVYDAESKKPIRQGTIIMILPVANKYRDVDGNGYYEFPCLSSDTYKIVTSITGYEDGNATLKVANGENKNHDFLLKTMRVEEPPWG